MRNTSTNEEQIVILEEKLRQSEAGAAVMRQALELLSLPKGCALLAINLESTEDWIVLQKKALSTTAGKSLLAELDASNQQREFVERQNQELLGINKSALEKTVALESELAQCKALETEVRKALILFGIHSSLGSKMKAIYALKRELGDKWLSEGKVKK